VCSIFDGINQVNLDFGFCQHHDSVLWESIAKICEFYMEDEKG